MTNHIPLWEQPALDGPPVRLPAGVPDDLEARHHAPRPLLVEQADLGIPRGPSTDGHDIPASAAECSHRIVAIGDSVTQGFQSMAINRTDVSWPKVLADSMGFDLSTPKFRGPGLAPGLPINLESVAHGIERAIRERPLSFDEPRAVATTVQMLETVRAYWEEGEGAADPEPQSGYFENLAIWGWDVRDALSKNRRWCADRIDEHQPWRSLPILRDLHPGVAHAMERTAIRTLWNTDEPSDQITQMAAAQALGAEGIETLLVALGANNALKSVIALDLVWSDEATYQDIDRKDAATVWTPSHFRTELAELADAVEQVGAMHTIWLTVPHVTVVPILRGVGEKPYYSRYFARYTRPWVSDEEFDAHVDPYLTGDDARAIDAAIDQYNWAIKKQVHENRTRGRDWYVVDLCGLLDRLAYRRYLTSPEARPTWWDEVPTDAAVLPDALLSMSPRPDTRFFSSDPSGRTQGGLIALDGVHPTTLGYGLIAQEVFKVLTEVVGVAPASGLTAAAGIDFSSLLRRDSLNSRPPTGLDEGMKAIGTVLQAFDVARTLLGARPF